MDIEAAKELVIKAGLKLVESGLIARTWGNVSCRINNNCFVVTPSGRNYMTLTPDEIVPVNIKDCSYSGYIKPSSEKGIHAEVYKLYPEINFIIHTHQENASIIGASDIDSIKTDNSSPSLGSEVICAAYALPGTKKLKRNVIEALNNSKGKAVIMKHHGALCVGRDYDEAFSIASKLENTCYNFIINQYFNISGKNSFDPFEMAHFALYLNNKIEGSSSFCLTKSCCSARTENGFAIYYGNGEKTEVPNDAIDCSLPREAEVYNAIYKEYKDINHIQFKSTPEIDAISQSGIELRPLLDDFAQIAGTMVKIADMDPIKVINALRRSSVVFLRSGGALCCGKTKDDAVAVSMVTQKACKAFIVASLFGKVKPINAFECILMRYNYLYKYSKQMEKKNR